MGKQRIEQMEPQQPQLLFYNDSTNQTGPPYYVDLFIEEGQTAIIPFADGECKLIKGPDSWLLVSNKPEPPRPIMLLIDNLKQVVDRTGILRQLIIVNTNNQQTNTYPTKRKSTKQIDNNNNTNGLKNGLTSPIYGKCSPNQTINTTNLTTDQTTELNGLPTSPVVDQQYPFCSLCYDYSLMNGNHQLNHNQLNGQLNNTINNQLNTVPTNATSSIYNQSLPLLGTTQIPPPPPQPTNSLPQSTVSCQLTSVATTVNHPTAQLQSQQPNSLQTACSSKTFNSPISASNRPFNLDNLLNNQNNNLILKAAKNKLNLPLNYNGQTTMTTNKFLLNNTGKLSPKHNNYQTATNLISMTTNSKINSSQKADSSATIKNNRSSSYEEQQPNNNKKTTRNTTLNNLNTAANNLNSTKHKAKSIYSNHYQDVYYPSHLHSNNQTINNYELKVRKEKYSNNNHNLTTMPFNSMNDKLINNRIIKRKDVYRLNDKHRSTNEQLTSSFHKKFDEVKSVGCSPVTSNSPISEHYDFSSEESEMNLPTTTNTSTSSTTNSNQSFKNNSSVNNNKKLIKNDDYLINKNHHKYLQNSNCVLNYQTTTQSTHYRSQKEFFKRPISQNNQLHKMNKESLEPINKRSISSRELKDKDLKLTNGNSKRKLLQEEDRDDGYVGDEFDYKIYNLQSHHHQSQKDEPKRINKLNSDNKYALNKKSFNQNESKNSQSRSPVNNVIKRPINNLDHNNTKIVKTKDELIKKEVISIEEDNLLKDRDLKNRDETNSVKSLASNSSLKSNNSLPKLIIKKENIPNNRIVNTKIANVQKDNVKVEKIDQLQNKLNDNKSTTEQKSIKTVTKLQNTKSDIKIEDKIKEELKEIKKEINKIDKKDEEIEQLKENSSQQKTENLESINSNQEKVKSIKQNEMPKICHAFNLIDTLVTSNLVRLKWTKNNGISLMNLERPNYQIEMIYIKKEENGQTTKCSRIVQQCTQKSSKIVNLNPEQEYTFRVRLVHEDQLYLSNDLTVTTLTNLNDKQVGNKRNKLKKDNAIKDQQNTLNSRPIEQQNVQTKIHRKNFNLTEFKLILNNLSDKFQFIGKEKFYALIYLFLFFTLCYLFAIICYNSYMH